MAPQAPAGPSDSRRRFLNWLLSTSAGALAVSILYPVVRFISPPQVPEAATHQVEAGGTNDPDLLEKGFKIVRFGAEPVILLRLSDTEYRAFSATCTHLECIVEYRKNLGVIWCNCHNGQFDLTGHNIAGPPPKPLTPFKVHVVARRPGEPGTIVVARG
jgi:cytochrome b6-f complex iron-sulfur subunit